MAAVIEEEKRTVTAIRNASARTLRSKPNAKNGVAASIFATAPKSLRKRTKSPAMNKATMTKVIAILMAAAVLNGRILESVMRRDHMVVGLSGCQVVSALTT